MRETNSHTVRLILFFTYIVIKLEIMFHLFESYTKRMKGYKITTKDRTKKIGVAAKSLKILREKACNKFKVGREK